MAYIGGPLALLLLEKPGLRLFGVKNPPLGIITRITNYLDSMWVFKQGFSLYKLGSYFFIVGLWAFFLMYIPQMLGQNPVTAYYANSSGHWISWLALVATITVFGYFNIIKGAYVGALIYSVHELIWLIFDGIYLGQFIALFIHYWPLVAVLSFLGAGYFLAYRSLPRWKEVAIVASIIAFDVVWYVGGWQIGVQNFYPNPKTPLFTDNATNLIEILSWVLPAIIALLQTPKTIRRLGTNVFILGLITAGLQFGALGPPVPIYGAAGWTLTGNPAAALIIVYAAIQIWPVYKSRHANALAMPSPNEAAA